MEHAAATMMEEFVTKRVKGYEALETRIVPGLPAEEIVRQAVTAKADLVVMGTRSRSGLKRLMLGSVADGVVRACECPVLVVPEGLKARKRG
jgi:nucleotide-binding universal stress UspA family protein